MSSRSYAQFCGVAAAMDVLGERWAVLVVRDLLAGPRRYTDLLRALPGMSTDMLATRLTELERAGVVHRSVLEPPAAAKVYELTDLGRSLEPVLYALARWGLRRLPDAEYVDAPVTREWIEFALQATYVPRRTTRRLRIRFTLENHVVVATIGRDRLEVGRDGDPDGPVDVEVAGTVGALVELLVDPDRAPQLVGDGVVTIAGIDAAVAAALAAFSLDQPRP